MLTRGTRTSFYQVRNCYVSLSFLLIFDELNQLNDLELSNFFSFVKYHHFSNRVLELLSHSFYFLEQRVITYGHFVL